MRMRMRMRAFGVGCYAACEEEERRGGDRFHVCGLGKFGFIYSQKKGWMGWCLAAVMCVWCIDMVFVSSSVPDAEA